MRVASFPRTDRPPRWLSLLVVATAFAIALMGTRDRIGGWNDASRLATVECLVDYHTLAIDRSIYVDVAHAPVPPACPGLLDLGTGDKLWIDGHFYSDKSPVPALLMAGVYRVWQGWTGRTARACPEHFVWWMSFTSSGIAYVIAVWCIFQLGGPLGLPVGIRLALTAGFAVATVAPIYAQQVNNHVLLLAVAAALMLGMAHLAKQTRDGSSLLHASLGFWAGLAYTIDLGAGPVLLVCVLGLVVYRVRSVRSVLVYLLAACPWLILHHAVNYAVGGTFRPANAVAEYLMWPGSPFHEGNITGSWNHPSFARFLRYALDLPFGRRGILGHNLALFLAWLGFLALLRFRPRELPEIITAGCCAAGIWLTYAIGSNNLSGLCCSVRWLVPLLAPCFFILAVLLRDHRDLVPDFLILSGWSALIAALFCIQGGLWEAYKVPGFFFIYAAALLSWGAYHLRRMIAASAGTKYHQPGIELPTGC